MFLENPTVAKWLTFIDSRIGLEPIADGVRTVQATANLVVCYEVGL
jgi:hypothetical protein